MKNRIAFALALCLLFSLTGCGKPSVPVETVPDTVVFTDSCGREVEVPEQISRIVAEQEMVVEGCVERNMEKIFNAFCHDPLVTIPESNARKLFAEMVENTKAYLTEYLI